MDEIIIKQLKKITSCTITKGTDDRFYCNRSLYLVDSEIERLPDNLIVNGSLDLRGSNIKELPKNLTVKGVLDIEDTDISELPENLHVYQELYINTKITYIPEDIIIGGCLNLEQTNVAALPKSFTVGEYLSLYDTKIDSLSEHLIVGGTLYLNKSKKEINFPKTFIVGGSINLSFLKPDVFPENLIVGKDLYIRDDQLALLPENFIVGRDLWIIPTGKEVSLKNITVGGSIYFGKTKIKELPEKLTIGRNLSITGTKITKLPKNITIGGNLYHREFQIKEEDLKNINKNTPTFYEWENGKYIKVDGILSEVIRHKGNLYIIKGIGRDEVSYLVTDGYGNYAHGKTLEQAKADLIYKTSKRDKNVYKNFSLDKKMTLEEGIICYRIITGACSLGVKSFIDRTIKNKKDKYTIREIAKDIMSAFVSSTKQLSHYNYSDDGVLENKVPYSIAKEAVYYADCLLSVLSENKKY